MTHKRFLTLGLCLAVLLVTAAVFVAPAEAAPSALTPIEQLGKAIYFDARLSANGNQSCASCHGVGVGFTGPDSAVNAGTVVYEGSIDGAYGNRKPPTAAYAGESPNLHFNEVEGEWIGGMFWDGRATGETWGDPLAEQAVGPFLNPLEHALASKDQLVGLVASASYKTLYQQVCGAGVTVDQAYECIGRSIAAYERSKEVSPFTSKFDKFWDTAKAKKKDVTRIRLGTSSTDPYRWQAYRNLGLSDTELQGLAVFNDPNRANCSACHSLQPGASGYPLFTDFSYHNLGLPKNPDNPYYAVDPGFIDYGLGGYLFTIGDERYSQADGQFKTPTLRNADQRPSSGFVKAYGHNGVFKSLDEIVMFYHWRGMGGGMMGGGGGGGMGGGGMGGGGMGGGGMMFGEPEVPANLADLNAFPGMYRSYIVSFLRTLTDGYYRK